jgi:hypothetical protein
VIGPGAVYPTRTWSTERTADLAAVPVKKISSAM